jgi:hypothetical protein
MGSMSAMNITSCFRFRFAPPSTFDALGTTEDQNDGDDHQLEFFLHKFKVAKK